MATGVESKKALLNMCTVMTEAHNRYEGKVVSLITTITVGHDRRGVQIINEAVMQLFLVGTDPPSVADVDECCQWDLPIKPLKA